MALLKQPGRWAGVAFPSRHPGGGLCGRKLGEISPVSHLPRAVARQVTLSPGQWCLFFGTVWPRPTGADPTGARDFTPSGRRYGHAN